MIKNLSYVCAVTIIGLFAGCSDKNATVQPTGAIIQKESVIPTNTPKVNLEQTKDLFSLISKKEVGDKSGKVEMRKEGILIHPGETQPTKVTFNLSGKYQKLEIRPFIAVLPDDALALKEAGTVGVEFFLDGKSESRLVVDRTTTLTKTLDLTNVETLTIIVDNFDSKAWFDWFMLGIVSRN